MRPLLCTPRSLSTSLRLFQTTYPVPLRFLARSHSHTSLASLCSTIPTNVTNKFGLAAKMGIFITCSFGLPFVRTLDFHWEAECHLPALDPLTLQFASWYQIEKAKGA